MEKSPLQLMSRMASVVKGTYPKTTQIENVVDLPAVQNDLINARIIAKMMGIEKEDIKEFLNCDKVTL